MERKEKEEKLKSMMVQEEFNTGRRARLALAYSLGADLHESWRKGYAAKNTQEDGTIKPREKKTSDEVWIAKHGTNIIDIANASFAELPKDWQGENLEAARVAVDLVYGQVMAGQEISEEELQRLSAIVHEKWLERNTWAKDGELGVPYAELPREEQEKDTVQLRDAMKKVEQYKKGEISIESLEEQYGLEGREAK